MFSDSELFKVKQIVYEKLHLCCDEAHKHSADCFIGTKQSKLLAQLIEQVEILQHKQKEASMLLGENT